MEVDLSLGILATIVLASSGELSMFSNALEAVVFVFGLMLAVVKVGLSSFGRKGKELFKAFAMHVKVLI